MTDVALWHDLMPSSVELKAFLSQDEYGTPTYADPVSYRCRWVQQTTELRLGNRTIQAKGWVVVGSDVTISPRDILVLPDETTPPILQVNRYTDELGGHHSKVFYGGTPPIPFNG